MGMIVISGWKFVHLFLVIYQRTPFDSSFNEMIDVLPLCIGPTEQVPSNLLIFPWTPQPHMVVTLCQCCTHMSQDTA